jgi:UDP-N-acetyl-D-mannosaminuronic acid dehydrogenase
VNIAFANEMALVCENLGVNVYEIIELVNELPSRMMHIPGAGVGGHCLPKDTWLLRYGLNQYGTHKMEPRFVALAREINNQMPIHMALLVEDALKKRGKTIKGATITVLGIAYLENADDTRNTPAAAFIEALQEMGAKVVLHDPYVREWDLGPQKIERDLRKAAKNSDCLAIVTRHKEYLKLNFDELRGLMRTPVLIDGRNVYDRDAVVSKGFEYRGIGKVGID